MSKLMVKILGIATVAVSGLTDTVALGGDNGNDSSGGAGSHGAATSGMTYHSEPVSSPWNRLHGQWLKTGKRRTRTAAWLQCTSRLSEGKLLSQCSRRILQQEAFDDPNGITIVAHRSAGLRERRRTGLWIKCWPAVAVILR